MNILTRSRQSKELKKLIKENAKEGKPLSVMDDLVFKAMLSAETEDSREALRCLLSACIGRTVSAARIMNNDLIPAHLAGKAPRLDVQVTFNDGEIANLEMQIEKTGDDLKTRAAIIAAMLVAGQTKRGKDYRETRRAYQIFFLNCELFPQSDRLPRRYSYREQIEHDQLTELSEIILYEMPKLGQRVKEMLSGKIDISGLHEDEKWCMYMKYRHEEQAEPLIQELYRKEEGIMRAEKAVNGLSRDYLKYMREMNKEIARLDRGQAIYDAKQEARTEGLAEGRTKGLAEGRTKGLAEGLAEGRAEGRTEGLAEGTRIIALKMKEMGDSVEKIHAVTGLSPETIEKLF